MAKKKLTFKEAIEATPDVLTGYRVGLKALGDYAKKIEVENTRQLNGSVDIDDCTTHKYPNDNRWDYALAYNEEVYFVEVHTANTDQVSVVIKKLQWLKDWLNGQAPEINKLKAGRPFIWIPSGKNRILKSSSEARRISQAKIELVKSLKL